MILEETRGACPKCKQKKSTVMDTRQIGVRGVAGIRRRRACRCGHRWTTYEVDKSMLETLLRSHKTMGEITKFVQRVK